MVVDCWAEGSWPTMLKPNVVESSGLSAVRERCVSVLVEGCGFAPPTVADMAWSAESEIVIGTGALEALAGQAINESVSATPPVRASFRAKGRNTCSTSNSGPARRHAQ